MERLSWLKSVAMVKLDSGHMVKARSVNNDGKGSRTMLSVRPERCIVSSKKSSSMSMLDARIEELIYFETISVADECGR